MKPSHRLKILHKPTGNYTEVGAGWENADGSISVQLNPAIVLDWRDRAECVLTLFRVETAQPVAATYPMAPPVPPMPTPKG